MYVCMYVCIIIIIIISWYTQSSKNNKTRYNKNTKNSELKANQKHT